MSTIFSEPTQKMMSMYENDAHHVTSLAPAEEAAMRNLVDLNIQKGDKLLLNDLDGLSPYAKNNLASTLIASNLDGDDVKRQMFNNLMTLSQDEQLDWATSQLLNNINSISMGDMQAINDGNLHDEAQERIGVGTTTQGAQYIPKNELSLANSVINGGSGNGDSQNNRDDLVKGVVKPTANAGEKIKSQNKNGKTIEMPNSNIEFQNDKIYIIMSDRKAINLYRKDQTLVGMKVDIGGESKVLLEIGCGDCSPKTQKAIKRNINKGTSWTVDPSSREVVQKNNNKPVKNLNNSINRVITKADQIVGNVNDAIKIMKATQGSTEAQVEGGVVAAKQAFTFANYARGANAASAALLLFDYREKLLPELIREDCLGCKKEFTLFETSPYIAEKLSQFDYAVGSPIGVVQALWKETSEKVEKTLDSIKQTRELFGDTWDAWIGNTQMADLGEAALDANPVVEGSAEAVNDTDLNNEENDDLMVDDGSDLGLPPEAQQDPLTEQDSVGNSDVIDVTSTGASDSAISTIDIQGPGDPLTDPNQTDYENQVINDIFEDLFWYPVENFVSTVISELDLLIKGDRNEYSLNNRKSIPREDYNYNYIISPLMDVLASSILASETGVIAAIPTREHLSYMNQVSAFAASSSPPPLEVVNAFAAQGIDYWAALDALSSGTAGGSRNAFAFADAVTDVYEPGFIDIISNPSGTFSDPVLMHDLREVPVMDGDSHFVLGSEFRSRVMPPDLIMNPSYNDLFDDFDQPIAVSQTQFEQPMITTTYSILGEEYTFEDRLIGRESKYDQGLIMEHKIPLPEDDDVISYLDLSGFVQSGAQSYQWVGDPFARIPVEVSFSIDPKSPDYGPNAEPFPNYKLACYTGSQVFDVGYEETFEAEILAYVSPTRLAEIGWGLVGSQNGL